MPQDGVVFDDVRVPRVDIFLSQADLDFILNPENRSSNEEFSATFTFTDNGISETVTPVGFRLRGNTSRRANKKSFKVSFNTFVDEQKFHGLEKMNLNGEHNDPSISRSKMVWDILNATGVPASRANHVELYINNEYYGLYANIEHIDEEFVWLRFGNKNGNLYKCLYPADLNYISTNPEVYKMSAGDRRVYELKINEWKDDYSDLSEFINILNREPSSTFLDELERVFNVNMYLKNLAVEVLSGHWDGYSYNKNNFYLYKNTQSARFEYITYDVDNTLGIDWIGRDWANRNIYTWDKGGEYRPLFERIISHSVYRERYSYFISQLLDGMMNPIQANPKIDELREKLEPFALNDMYRTMDYGYSFSDFQGAFSYYADDHTNRGIKQYISDRHSSAANQLDFTGVSPFCWYILNEPTTPGSPVTFRAKVEDDTFISEVVFEYSVNDGDFEQVFMTDDGQYPDLALADDIYSVEVDYPENSGILRYRISLKDDLGNLSYYPYNTYFELDISGYTPSPIRINEFMPANTSAHADEWGDFDDWIELVNTSPSVSISEDLYLTDNPERPYKWKLPQEDWQPQSFHVFWADDEPEEGRNHTTFKLSGLGEYIGLYQKTDVGPQLVDEVNYTTLEQDVSLGRIPDGVGGFQILPFYSPGKSNSSPPEEESNQVIIPIWPNPSDQDFQIQMPKSYLYFQLFDMKGRMMEVPVTEVEPLRLEWDVSTIPSGIYMLQVVFDDQTSGTSRIIVRHE